MDDATRGEARPVRRFLLTDAMVLVAATALAFAATRACYAVYSPFNLPRPGFEFGTAARVVSVHIALASSLALIPLRLRQPRPPLLRLMRQPGMAMSLAVLVSFAFQMSDQLDIAMECWFNPLWPYHPSWVAYPLSLPFQNACAVSVAWLILKLSGGWQPEPSWLDRLGRTLGVFWIAAAVVVKVVWWISFF